MNILCPNCQTSIPVVDGTRVLHCAACGLEADVSSLGTAPGLPSYPVVRDMSGETLGAYHLEGLIGAGGMGVVYKARDARNDTVCAVKVLNPDYQWKQADFVQRFKREIKALSRLSHPGIVHILDSGEQDGIHFLVTELVDGENLAEVLRKGPMKIADAVHIMTQVCEAITYAHLQGIVHRDIKPANIIISGQNAKVLDFGLAQVTGGESKLTTLTRTNLAMGTFNYLSPEQRLSAKTVDHRSDIYSLGVVFYEMITGTLPMGSFQPPSKLRNETPKRCDRIITRSLQSSPALRYPDTASLSAEVGRVLKPSLLRRPQVLIAAAAAALLMGLSLALLGNIPAAEVAREIPFDSVQLNLESQSRNLAVESTTTIQRSNPNEAAAVQTQNQGPTEETTKKVIQVTSTSSKVAHPPAKKKASIKAPKSSVLFDDEPASVKTPPPLPVSNQTPTKPSAKPASAPKTKSVSKTKDSSSLSSFGEK